VQPYWRSVGGDELNVSVALARLGVRSHWISAIGDGPDGKFVKHVGTTAGVIMDVPVIDNERTGTFIVVPEEKRVYYNRRDSAFARHQSRLFDWPTLLKDCTWLHMTGITPPLSGTALTSWQRALDYALLKKIACSIDLNHRPQLGYTRSFVRPPSMCRSLLDLIQPCVVSLDL
jgi:2-dehydro-3-deoxygluconokinase